MINIIKNKRGEGTYIYLCVLILVISMLLSVLVLYMGLCAQVAIQKRDVEHKIDGYLSEVATKEFNSIKQGTYEPHIDYTALENGVYGALGFDTTDTEYVYDNEKCTMTRPAVTVLRGDGFGVKVMYEVTFPVHWNGKAFTELTVPVSITSYYKLK